MKNYIAISIFLALVALPFLQAMMPMHPDQIIERDSIKFKEVHKLECSICFIAFIDKNKRGSYSFEVATTNCNHAYHKECIQEYLPHNEGNKCPNCRRKIENTNSITIEKFLKSNLPSSLNALEVIFLEMIKNDGAQKTAEFIIRLEIVNCIQKIPAINEIVIKDIYNLLKYAITCEKTISVLALVALQPKFDLDRVDLLKLATASVAKNMVSIVSHAFEFPLLALITTVTYNTNYLIKQAVLEASSNHQFIELIDAIEDIEYNGKFRKLLFQIAMKRNFTDLLKMLVHSDKTDSDLFTEFVDSLISDHRIDVITEIVPDNYSVSINMEQWLRSAVDSKAFDCFSVLLSRCSSNLLNEMYQIFDLCIRTMPCHWAYQMMQVGFSFCNASENFFTNILLDTVMITKDVCKIDFLLSNFKVDDENLKKIFKSYLKDGGRDASVILLFIESNPALAQIVFE